MNYNRLVDKWRFSALAHITKTEAQSINAGEAIRIVQSNIRQQLADYITKSSGLIRITPEPDGALYLQADFVAMPLDEFIAYQRKSFAEGVKHREGFSNLGDLLYWHGETKGETK